MSHQLVDLKKDTWDFSSNVNHLMHKDIRRGRKMGSIWTLQYIKLKLQSCHYRYWQWSGNRRTLNYWRTHGIEETHPMRWCLCQKAADASVTNIEILLICPWPIVRWWRPYAYIPRIRYSIITHIHSTEFLKMHVAGDLLPHVNNQQNHRIILENVFLVRNNKILYTLINLVHMSANTIANFHGRVNKQRWPSCSIQTVSYEHEDVMKAVTMPCSSTIQR